MQGPGSPGHLPLGSDARFLRFKRLFFAGMTGRVSDEESPSR